MKTFLIILFGFICYVLSDLVRIYTIALTSEAALKQVVSGSYLEARATIQIWEKVHTLLDLGMWAFIIYLAIHLYQKFTKKKTNEN